MICPAAHIIAVYAYRSRCNTKLHTTCASAVYEPLLHSEEDASSPRIPFHVIQAKCSVDAPVYRPLFESEMPQGSMPTPDDFKILSLCRTWTTSSRSNFFSRSQFKKLCAHLASFKPGFLRYFLAALSFSPYGKEEDIGPLFFNYPTASVLTYSDFSSHILSSVATLCGDYTVSSFPHDVKNGIRRRYDWHVTDVMSGDFVDAFVPRLNCWTRAIVVDVADHHASIRVHILGSSRNVDISSQNIHEWLAPPNTNFPHPCFRVVRYAGFITFGAHAREFHKLRTFVLV